MAQRIKPVPLTPEQLQLEKDVKRINERINEIAKRFGTESYAYNEYYSAIVSSIPEKYRRFSKHGILQIKRSGELYRTANTPATKQAQQRLLGLKTVGQLRKEARRSLKEEGEEITKQAIEERMSAIDEVMDFVTSNRDMFYVNYKNSEINNTIKIKKRKKTYKELIDIMNAYKSGAYETKDIFGGL